MNMFLLFSRVRAAYRQVLDAHLFELLCMKQMYNLRHIKTEAVLLLPGIACLRV